MQAIKAVGWGAVVVVAVLAISDEITVGHDFSRVIGSRHLPADDQVHALRLPADLSLLTKAH